MDKVCVGLRCKCGEYVALDIVPRVAADIVEIAPSASPNSDYAAALRVFDEYARTTDRELSIPAVLSWCKERLNPPKAADCA